MARIYYIIRRKTIEDIITPSVIGLLFLILGLAGVIKGPIPYLSIPGLQEFHQIISPELLGIGLTVLIIDQANKRRATKAYKKQLIRYFGSKHNQLASQAVEELRAEGWLTDGTLRYEVFYRSNLEGAELIGEGYLHIELQFITPLTNAVFSGDQKKLIQIGIAADLRNTTFFLANFKKTSLVGARFNDSLMQGSDFSSSLLLAASFDHARLEHVQFEGASMSGITFKGSEVSKSTDFSAATLDRANFNGCKGLKTEHLIKAKKLRQAILSDGNLYDGRFRLDGDLEDFHSRLGFLPTDSDKELAEFYGVTLEQYRIGQQWADENLQKYRDV